MNGLPLIAGQQMDVNLLYQKVMELSEILRENREKTQGIVAGAEELAVRLLRSETRLIDGFGHLSRRFNVAC